MFLDVLGVDSNCNCLIWGIAVWYVNCIYFLEFIYVAATIWEKSESLRINGLFEAPSYALC
jgi:hypothetical protein